MDHLLWTEKYRPHSFSEMIGQEDIIVRIKHFVERKNMPHVLFAGPPGIGKTTLALVIARELYGDDWRQNFLELNASDERGIDIVRVKVKDFARTKAIGDAPFKIIYLDEADALTREAQQALRRTMENYTSTCRFILACNYSSKIIEPIQSRCAIFRFKPLNPADVKSLIDRIVKSENLTISNDAIEALISISEGDCRRVENILQASAAASSKITPELLYEVAAVAEPKEVKEMLVHAINKDFIKAREKLLRIMLDYGLSGFDMVRQIHKELLAMDIEQRTKMQFLERLAEAEYRLVEGSDEYIQLEGYLATIVRGS
ncbi:MAG: replication factor C small subunit [Candidatus Woesearchaeota archaeon]